MCRTGTSFITSLKTQTHTIRTCRTGASFITSLKTQTHTQSEHVQDRGFLHYLPENTNTHTIRTSAGPGLPSLPPWKHKHTHNQNKCRTRTSFITSLKTQTHTQSEQVQDRGFLHYLPENTNTHTIRTSAGPGLPSLPPWKHKHTHNQNKCRTRTSFITSLKTQTHTQSEQVQDRGFLHYLPENTNTHNKNMCRTGTSFITSLKTQTHTQSEQVQDQDFLHYLPENTNTHTIRTCAGPGLPSLPPWKHKHTHNQNKCRTWASFITSLKTQTHTQSEHVQDRDFLYYLPENTNTHTIRTSAGPGLPSLPPWKHKHTHNQNMCRTGTSFITSLKTQTHIHNQNMCNLVIY